MKIRWLILALLLVAVPLEAAEQAGIIKTAKGSIFIERAGQRSGATVGTPVFSGDLILTGDDGAVGITLRDNTLLSAGPRSILNLSSFSFDKTTQRGPSTLRSNAGHWLLFPEK